MQFTVSDDKSKVQADRVFELLSATYWAKNRTRESVQKSIENSLCFGVYDGERQIGFARCVTDYATMYWLADVVIDEAYKGRGLGKALIEAAVNHEKLKPLLGILATKDAHGLYEQYGFKRENGTFMRRPADG